MGRVIRSHGSAPGVSCEVTGIAVREWVQSEVPGGEFAVPTVCFFNDRPLLRADWTREIGAEDVALFVSLPQGGGGGGGSNPMKMALSVALMGAAAWAAPAIGVGLFNSGIVTSSIGAALTAGKFVAGGLALAGTAVLGGMLSSSPRTPSSLSSTRALESASPTYSLSPQTNTARLYQPIPTGYGTNLTTPDPASQPFWDYVGNDQYVYQLLCVGLGQYRIDEVRVGDTAVWAGGEYTGNFEGITVQIVNPGEAVTLFPDNVESATEVSGQTLLGPNEEGGWLGPFVANTAGTDANQLGVDTVFPRGLGHMEQNNSMSTLSVACEFQARRIDDAGQPLGDWFVLGTEAESAATRTPQRRSYLYSVEPGRYEVRAQRTSNASSDALDLNEVQWAGLRAYLPSKRVYPDETLIAVRMRATNSLTQQSARMIRVISTRMLPVWDADAQEWSEPAPTRSLSWALADICTSPLNGELDEEHLDRDALAQLAAGQAARGDNFCHVFDTPVTVWAALLDAGRSCRTFPRPVGTGISFYRDEPRTRRCGFFSPQNIVRGSFRVHYDLYRPEQPDRIVVEYVDRSAGFSSQSVPADLQDCTAAAPERKRIAGVDNRAQAFREGMYEAARNAWRNVTVEWTTEQDGRLLLLGEACDIAHPVVDWGVSGNLERWPEIGAFVVTLDREVSWTEGQEHYLSLRRRNGQPWGPVLVHQDPDGDPRRVLLDEDDFALVVADLDDPRDWVAVSRDRERTYWTFGPAESFARRVLITDIKPRRNGTFDISAVIDDERVYPADQGPVPDYDPGTNLPQTPDGPVVSGLLVNPAGTPEAPELLASWRPAPSATHYVAEWSRDNAMWTALGEVVQPEISASVPAGSIYLRVAGVGAIRGPWATWTGSVGDPEPPWSVPVSLVQPMQAGELALQWTASALASEYVLTLKSGATTLREVVVTGLTYTYTATMAELDGGPFREVFVELVARNEAGSSSASSLTATDPAPAVPPNLAHTVSGTSVTFDWTGVDGDVTGYILARGAAAGFGVADAAEVLRVDADAVSAAFDGLGSGTHYFRVFTVDWLYDLNPDVTEMQLSDEIAVSI